MNILKFFLFGVMIKFSYILMETFHTSDVTACDIVFVLIMFANSIKVIY